MNFKNAFVTVLLLMFLGMSYSSYAGDFKYVGVKKCKMCHGKKTGDQFKIWKNGPHAKAMESLKSKEAMEWGKKNGVADPSKEAKCLKCHSTMASVDKKLLDPKTKMTMEEGVSCESCHGPGSVYKKKSIMKDHEKAIASGLIVPTEKVCKTCHTKEGNPFYKPFDFKKMAAKIAHPVPKK